MKRLRSGREALSTLLLILCGCTAAPQKPPNPPPAPTAPALDSSYDWHGLMLLPFGSLIKDAPFPLHEVLMFRDEAHAAQADDAECYATDRAAPRFLERHPSTYLLCFKHDRLARVEASVGLPPAEAAQILGNACALWQRNAGAVQTGAVQAGAVQTGSSLQAQSSVAPPSADACEGRDGEVGYSARLEESSDAAITPLAIRLDTQAPP
jgi:hypothetical protein